MKKLGLALCGALVLLALAIGVSANAVSGAASVSAADQPSDLMMAEECGAEFDELE